MWLWLQVLDCFGQHHVGGDDGRILLAGVGLPAGKDEDTVFVIGNHQHCGRAVTAGGQGVDLRESLSGLRHIDALPLQVLGSGRKMPRLKDRIYCSTRSSERGGDWRKCTIGYICCIFVGAAQTDTLQLVAVPVQTIAEMSIVNQLKVSNNV